MEWFLKNQCFLEELCLITLSMIFYKTNKNLIIIYYFRYNTDNATVEDIRSAAEQANALDFILNNQFGF